MKHKVVIAGASGFVGLSLLESIKSREDYEIRALSRSKRKSNDKNDKVEWFQCDIFSLLDIENGLRGYDTAIYLVHSMLPSAKLTQGNFEDFDLILADNFARACKNVGIKRIIFLGGIIPNVRHLSRHLHSRLETEQVLKSTGIPLTSLRCGIILGGEGSSYNVMRNLISRLIFLACPKWTNRLSSPIHIDDVVRTFHLALELKTTYSENYDLGGADIISYKEMLTVLASKLGLSRFFIPVPFIPLWISKFWVHLITGAPKELIYPLVDSLREHIVPDPKNKFPYPENFGLKSFSESIDEIEKNDGSKIYKIPNAFKYTGREAPNEVRSIQRLSTFLRTDADTVSKIYFKWLPKFFRPYIIIDNKGPTYFFRTPFFKRPLLIVEFSSERSSKERVLYYVKGGMLAYGDGRGRLEFRNILDGRFTMAAIHEFRPKLPWFIYRYTQAIVHAFVMYSFRKYLIRSRM